MSTRETTMILIILVLFVTTVIFWVQSVTKGNELEQADTLSAALTDYLKARSIPRLFTACRTIDEGRYDRLTACLDAMNNADDLSKMFTRDDFKNPKNDDPGYIVIENEKGGETFQSANFTLYWNNEEVASGCATPGEIAPGFTCRFDFHETCEPGDNLEIKYEDKRAFLFTC